MIIDKRISTLDFRDYIRSLQPGMSVHFTVKYSRIKQWRNIFSTLISRHNRKIYKKQIDKNNVLLITRTRGNVIMIYAVSFVPMIFAKEEDDRSISLKKGPYPISLI